jgi:SAM-dependent methyltransferase
VTYSADLAYIYNAGFHSYSLNVAPGLLRLLRRFEVEEGLVLDLGCGSGNLARQLSLAGYGVVGFDPSRAMLAIAKRTAPHVTFVQAGIFEATLPLCAAALCLGEIISIACAESTAPLLAFFRRVRKALIPGGVFVVDYGQHGRLPAGMPKHAHWNGKDWTLLVDATVQDDILTRRVTTFRRAGDGYRRRVETHRLRLFDDAHIAALLARAGFANVRTVRNIGDLRFTSGHSAAIARTLF